MFKSVAAGKTSHRLWLDGLLEPCLERIWRVWVSLETLALVLRDILFCRSGEKQCRVVTLNSGRIDSCGRRRPAGCRAFVLASHTPVPRQVDSKLINMSQLVHP